MQTREQVDAGFQTAVEAHQRGDLAAAERAYRAVLALTPGHPAACNNLGLCLAIGGRVDEAVDWFRRARQADPGAADPAVNLAQALQQGGRTQEAFDAWRDAAAMRSGDMEPALAAAMLALELGRTAEAVAFFEQAAAATPTRDGTREVLVNQVAGRAARCIDAADLEHGHRLTSLLIRLAPDETTAVHLLEECLRTARIRHFDPGLREDLLHYYRSDAVEHHELSRAACELLGAQYPLLGGDGHGDGLAPWQACDVHRDALLERLLVLGRVATPPLERALTTLRREVVAAVVREGRLPDAYWQRFVTALALQCFTNEYLFATSPQEEDRCADLQARLERDSRDLDALVALGCYRALTDVPAARRLAAGDETLPGLIGLLLRRTVSDVLDERTLRSRFEEAVLDDAVSQAVRRQYEESPYPRWQNLERQPATDIATFLRHELPGYEPAPSLSGPAAILVAGCGTGEHALRVATRHPTCRVVAVDLSIASLAYGLRKAGEHRVANIHFQQRDILDIAPPDGPFALIESVGVLHHMRDPVAGLAALCGVLAPGGVVKLGLYSRLARRHVTAARERIAGLGLEPTPQGMRSLRARVLRGEEPALSPLLGSLDFYSMSAVRDLLFHVQEHRFDVAGLRELLAGQGLRCIGFQVPAATRQRYVARFPDDPALADLDHLAAFEADHPDTFAGMYQFWCAREPAG